MSKSRSATPKAVTFPSIDISPSTDSTTSRPRIRENTPSGHRFEGLEQQLTSRPVSPHSFRRRPTEPSSHASSSLVRVAETPIDQPMSKRSRKESPQRRPSSTSSSSDSQDGMADTETDTSRNQPSEVPQPPAKPQPKKKRTRTLTTPHQSAVLHALLAQSRFPTTAMREEVGRSIGLSARKVQIWFQNQRQKARRPRSQSDAPRPPPQYGPFPAGSDPSAISSFSMIPDQGTSSGVTQLGRAMVRRLEEDQSAYSGHHSSGSFPSSLNSPPQLSGPGVPGSDYRLYPEHLVASSAYVHRPDPSSSTSRPYANPSPHAVRSSTPYSFPISRPVTTGRMHEREFSRTLPPLNFGSRQSRGSSATGFHSHAPLSRFAGMPPHYHSRSSTPEPSFAHQPPELFPRSSLVLPPPFTLQPAPQWDHSFSTPVRLEPLAGSQPCSVSGRSSPSQLPTCNDQADAGMVSPPSRSGRYDPVRATFVHTTPNPPLPSLAQETGSGSDLGDDREPR